MTLFDNLLKLYRKGDSQNTPREDFCTECLVGILKSDPSVLKSFAKQVLQVKTDHPFKVFSQKSYRTDNGDLGIVDIVFESETVLCFLEMKVDSGEGDGQLEKYDNILCELTDAKRECYLRYCTLYIDEKNGKENFGQFRWADVAVFLNGYTATNQLINEFYQFLKENKMAGNERFNHEDLVGLKVYSEVANKITEVFSFVGKKLSTFGSVNGGLNAGSHITKHNRLATYCYGVIGDNGNGSEVLVSFDFHGIRYKEEPVIAVQLFVNRNNAAFQKFSETAEFYFKDKKFEGRDIYTSGEYGGHIRYEKPVAMFFTDEEQLREMANWAEGRLDELDQFIKNTPELDWKDST